MSTPGPHRSARSAFGRVCFRILWTGWMADSLIPFQHFLDRSLWRSPMCAAIEARHRAYAAGQAAWKRRASRLVTIAQAIRAQGGRRYFVGFRFGHDKRRIKPGSKEARLSVLRLRALLHRATT